MSEKLEGEGGEGGEGRLPHNPKQSDRIVFLNIYKVNLQNLDFFTDRCPKNQPKKL